MKKTVLFLMFSLLTFAAYAADGDLDVSFGTNGFVTEGAPFVSHYSTIVQPDGKILVAGQALLSDFTTDYTLVRYNPNGSPDASFGTNGKVFADVNNKSDTLPTIVLQPDGKIVLVGISKNTQDRNIVALLRFNANGTLDATYGVGGKVFSSFTTSGTRGDTPSDAVLQPDGKIVVSGSWRGTAFCVARWNADGSLDTTFGIGGDRCNEGVPVGTGTTNSIALQADGKIVMSGGFTNSFTNPFDFIIYRFNPNGSLDTTFDNDGYVITDLNGGNDTAHTVIIKPDGKILAVGSARAINSPDTGFGLVQYNSDGSLDAGFGIGGKALTTFAGGEGFNERFPAVLQSNGKIVVARTRLRASPNVGNEAQIARFNPNGSLDATFGSGGQIVSTVFSQIRDITLQPDGKIIAVGANPQFSAATARFLNTDSAAPANNPTLRFSDFDGDAKTDIAVFRAGTWFINPSTNPSGLADAPEAVYGIQFGQTGDITVPADYDGDAKTDIAVWRAGAFANFYILNSSDNTLRIEQFGQTGDNPTVSGDWDADGKADLAVYRGGAQSFFYYRPSSQMGVNFIPVQWGTTGDTPIFGDFDGDRKLDATVYRPSNNTFYVRQSSNGTALVRQWGNALTDAIFAGDFDGDGKSDFAVQRFSGAEAGTWYIAQSGGTNRAFQWGTGSDTPVPADYDGDGKTDFAVFRRSTSTWYIYQSATNTARAAIFGTGTDFPLPLNLVR